MFGRSNPNIQNASHEVASPIRSASDDLQNTIRIVTSLLYPSLPYSIFLGSTSLLTLSDSTPTQPLLYSYLYFYLYPYSTFIQLDSTPFYPTLLCSTLLSSSLLSCTLPVFYFYSASTSTPTPENIPTGHKDL